MWKCPVELHTHYGHFLIVYGGGASQHHPGLLEKGLERVALEARVSPHFFIGAGLKIGTDRKLSVLVFIVACKDWFSSLNVRMQVH